MKFLSKVWSMIAIACSILIALNMTNAANAQTVDDILQRKVLRVGVLNDVPQFGLLGPSGKPEGYDIDVAELLAKYLGVELELVAVTASNRQSFLLTDKIDMMIATFGITPERAKQVLFSNPYVMIELSLVGAKSMNVNSLDQTGGMRIAVSRASNHDLAVTARAPKDAIIMRFDDDSSAAQAFMSGQADFFGTNQFVLPQLSAANPDQDWEPKIVLIRQYNGIAMRRSAIDLQRWVNTFLYYVKNNGELDAIYQKWFKIPMPEMPTF